MQAGLCFRCREQGNISRKFPDIPNIKCTGKAEEKSCIVKLNTRTTKSENIIALEDRLSKQKLEAGKQTNGLSRGNQSKNEDAQN